MTVSYVKNLYEGFLELKDRVSVCEELASFYRKNVEEQYENKVAPGMTVEPELPDELCQTARNYTDTAIISICRFSGEGWDRKGKSDFYLTEEEKIAMCKAVTAAGADYIKTSTGFGTAGATLEDIRLFRENIGPDVKMKAAGGVKTVADMEAFLEAGCDRIGTSSAIQLIQGEQTSGY